MHQEPVDSADHPSNANSDKDASPELETTPQPFVFSSQTAGASSSTKKGPAWIDPSDGNVSVSLASDKRLRKLRDGPEDDVISGRQYETKLRQQCVLHLSISNVRTGES